MKIFHGNVEPNFKKAAKVSFYRPFYWRARQLTKNRSAVSTYENYFIIIHLKSGK